jgi:hypothetical protein
MHTCSCNDLHGFCTCGIPNKKYAAYRYSKAIKSRHEKELKKIMRCDVLIFQNISSNKEKDLSVYWAIGERYNKDIWLYYWNDIGNFWEPYHQVFNYGYIKQVMKDKNNIIITEKMKPELYEEWRK